MRIAGLQKLTLLDYPDKTAATVFTPGCNLRCPFCHNAELVCDPSNPTTALPSTSTSSGFDISLEAFFAFLDTRKGLLEGICITGGEPLLQTDLASFCQEIHERGFAVKLDTNGTFPDRMQLLIEEGLIDYVALDIKNSPERYGETVGVPTFDTGVIAQSIAILQASSIDHEFRTTVVQEFHDLESLRSLAAWIKGAEAWYLQGFVDSENIIAGHGNLHAYSAREMEAFVDALKEYIPPVHLRGM